MSNLYTKLILRLYEREPAVKLRLFYFPLFLIMGFLLLKIEWNGVYMNIVLEDSFVENAQFAAYSGASIIAFAGGYWCLKKGRRLAAVCLLIFASLSIFVAMEEISWGQRLFSVSTPGWLLQRNVQKEINIHNLKPVQSGLFLCYVIVGLLFSFGWIPAKYITSGEILRRDVKDMIQALSPRWYLMMFFLPVAVTYAYFSLPAVQIDYFVVWDDQEPAELLLALGFLLYAAAVLINLKHGAVPPPAGEPARGRKERGCLRREAVLAGALLLAGLGGLGWRYVQVWHSSGSMWRRTLALIPFAAMDHNNLGNALVAQGKKDEAISKYKLALEIKPDYADVHYNLAQVLNGQGRKDLAVMHYKLALKAQPEYFQARNNLAAALAAQGKYDEAASHYELVLKTRPGLAEARYNLANALTALGRLDEAIVQYKLTISERPGLVEAYNNLANILVRQGKLEEAAPYYRQALSLNPRYEQARRNLEIILRRQSGPGPKQHI